MGETQHGELAHVQGEGPDAGEEEDAEEPSVVTSGPMVTAE